MPIRGIFELLCIAAAIVKGSASLRGEIANDSPALYANQRSTVQKQEMALNGVLKSLMNSHATAKQAAKGSTLDSGDAHVEPFDGYLISLIHARSDCTGQGKFITHSPGLRTFF
jgi:hypothetical protein